MAHRDARCVLVSTRSVLAILARIQRRWLIVGGFEAGTADSVLKVGIPGLAEVPLHDFIWGLATLRACDQFVNSVRADQEQAVEHVKQP